MRFFHQITTPVTLSAADGYTLRGYVWRHRGGGGAARPVTVVNCATSVRCDYYFRFAAWLFAQGRDVLVYDYRGIGGSRPAQLAKLRANWLDWGRLDCEAALRYALDAFPGQPLDVVAHSIGGCVLGLAASNAHVRHVVTVGAQYAYWRDYRPEERRRMWWKNVKLMVLLGFVVVFLLYLFIGMGCGLPAWSKCTGRHSS